MHCCPNLQTASTQRCHACSSALASMSMGWILWLSHPQPCVLKIAPNMAVSAAEHGWHAHYKRQIDACRLKFECNTKCRHDSWLTQCHHQGLNACLNDHMHVQLLQTEANSIELPFVPQPSMQLYVAMTQPVTAQCALATRYKRTGMQQWQIHLPIRDDKNDGLYTT